MDGAKWRWDFLYQMRRCFVKHLANWDLQHYNSSLCSSTEEFEIIQSSYILLYPKIQNYQTHFICRMDEACGGYIGIAGFIDS